jgi:hypothetical protein
MLRCTIFVLLFLATSGTSAQDRRGSQRPLASRNAAATSPHCHGPGALEGWTLLYPRPDAVISGGPDRLPLALVISRRGHIIRRIQGASIIWTWYFVDDHRVAIETGPLHFGMECKLVDVNSGNVLADYNCYDHPPENPPQWVSVLENATSPCGYCPGCQSASSPASQ